MLWLETPTVLSKRLSSLLRCDVYLKLENLQISQSYKYRGLSFLAQHIKNQHGPSARLIVASGGNAGLATACAANTLGLHCTVYIPDGVSDDMLRRLKDEGADVVVGGDCYLHALRKAEAAAKLDTLAVLVPAYDEPLLWEGHGSMIREVSRQIPSKPDAIFCSVGGGGLLGGVLVGCKEVGWSDVPVVTLETHGAACFYHSMSMNENNKWKQAPLTDELLEFQTVFDNQNTVNVVHLDSITSKASSLGASQPAAGVVKMALQREGLVVSVTVPDEMSMQSARLFAEDHKLLVELACSTTLSVAYNPTLFSDIMGRLSEVADRPKSVLLVVCGGVKISIEELEEYREIVNKVTTTVTDWHVNCMGERLSIPIKLS